MANLSLKYTAPPVLDRQLERRVAMMGAMAAVRAIQAQPPPTLGGMMPAVGSGGGSGGGMPAPTPPADETLGLPPGPMPGMLPPGGGLPPSSPGMGAPPAPAGPAGALPPPPPIPPRMAAGGQFVGQPHEPAMVGPGPEARGLLPTVVPYEAIVEAVLSGKVPRRMYAEGGMVDAPPAPSGLVAEADRPLDVPRSGKPAPKAFTRWLSTTDEAQTNEIGALLLASYRDNPDDAAHLWDIVMEIARDPAESSDLPPELQSMATGKATASVPSKEPARGASAYPERVAAS